MFFSEVTGCNFSTYLVCCFLMLIILDRHIGVDFFYYYSLFFLLFFFFFLLVCAILILHFHVQRIMQYLVFFSVICDVGLLLFFVVVVLYLKYVWIFLHVRAIRFFYDGAMSVFDFFKVNPPYDLVKERKKEKHDHNDQNIPLCVM